MPPAAEWSPVQQGVRAGAFRVVPLPHQRVAVYEHMLPQSPLRFLLADDAGAGKTVMTGLHIREMLNRGRLRPRPHLLPGRADMELQRELRISSTWSFGFCAAKTFRQRSLANDEGLSSSAWTRRPTESIRERLAAAQFDLVVFDEAATNWPGRTVAALTPRPSATGWRRRWRRRRIFCCLRRPAHGETVSVFRAVAAAGCHVFSTMDALGEMGHESAANFFHTAGSRKNGGLPGAFRFTSRACARR